MTKLKELLKALLSHSSRLRDDNSVKLVVQEKAPDYDEAEIDALITLYENGLLVKVYKDLHFRLICRMLGGEVDHGFHKGWMIASDSMVKIAKDYADRRREEEGKESMQVA